MAVTNQELVAESHLPGEVKKSVPDVVTTIAAGRQALLPFKELWEFRELLYFLTWRDVKVRYKQTILGAAWALIQPVVTMVIFTLIFGRLARISSEGIPYPVFSYTGLLPWQLFAGGLQRSVQSFVASAPLITKIYFPRLMIPLASTLSATIDFAIAFVVLVVMAVGYGLMPTWRVIAIPAFLGLTLLSALGVGLWLSALNVRYRDVGHAVPFLIQVWMYASPVVYPVGLVPERLRLLYSLNPMVGAVEGFRWALLGKPVPDLQTIVTSAGVAVLLLIWGLVYFRHTERTFADVI